MSLMGTDTFIRYATNGSSTIFPVPFYFGLQSDLLVLHQVSGATSSSVKVLNGDYTVSGTPDDYGYYSAGGTVTFGIAPAPGTLFIQRRTPRTQLADYTPNDPFPATTHEHILDKLTLLDQEFTRRFQGLADAPPSNGTWTNGDFFLIRQATAGGVWGWIFIDTAFYEMGPVSLTPVG
jgi:hypothetical protein